MKRITLTALLILLCFTFQGFAQKLGKRNHSTSIINDVQVLDEFVYTQLFYIVVNFEKESEKQSLEEIKATFRDYVKNKSNLTEEQMLLLKAVSANFVSSSPMLDTKQKLNNALLYRNEIRKSFGENAFKLFSKFLDDEIASNLKVVWSKNFVSSNTSNISLSGPNNNILTGFASTVAFSLDKYADTCPTSVSATVTGPGVSLSGTGICDPNTLNTQVTMTTTNWLPSSTYTINATHGFNGQSANTTDSTTTPGTPNVISVNFERIETDDLPISVNPNEGDGLRIFSDDKVPNDLKNRRKIRVKAKYGQAVAGVAVYFESYDLDDPSIADTENIMGDDNKDELDPIGRFSIPSGATGCEIFEADLIKCTTNSLGDVSADFTVTRQPGDNFSIAASTDALQLGQITVSGLNLLKGNNQPVPIVCQNSNVCRSEMLTVWRRLHIEVDSMGVVSGNKETGSFTATKKVSNTETFVYITPDNPIENFRFSDGRLVAGNKKFRVISSGLDYVILKPQYGGASTVMQGERFVLYDDDDYNNSNGSELIGDNGENITNPSYMMEGLSATSDLPDDNILAPAYIKPVYDAIDTRDDNTFHLNLENSQQTTIRAFFDKWDSSATNTDRKYWSAYILGAYQPEESADGDGLGSNTYALVDCVSGNTTNGCDGEGSGTLIFLEMNRKRELQAFSTLKTNPQSLQVTVAHEIGHLLGCNHGELGIMGNSLGREISSNKFTATSLNVIRNIKHP
jgi:hypothetical protein